MERTLIIAKPDAVQRGLSGEILRRFEQRGLKLIGMKFMQVTPELAAQHYGEHVGKPFYDGLVKYITSGPVVVMAFAGQNATAAARVTIGATKPHESPAGTIRGDFGMDIGRNLVHGSDSPESGQREVGIFFNEDELFNWGRDTERWIYE